MTAKADRTPVPTSSSLRLDGLISPIRQNISRIIVYTLLTVGACFMFFPMAWMITASLKPEWQILTEPISIPNEWVHVQAGNTTQEIPVWYATNPEGEREEVIRIGTRRYTTVIDSAQMNSLMSVPGDSLSAAAPTEINDLVLNVRTWIAEDGSEQQVVALARDGDNIVVASVESLADSTSRMALADVNAGSRTLLDIEGHTFQARELEESGLAVIPIGPESQLTIVAPASIAAETILVPADQLTSPEFVEIGNTELQRYSLADGTSGTHYVIISSETWQPIIDLDVMRDHAVSVDNDQLSDEPEIRKFNLAPMPVYSLVQDDAEPTEVVALLQTSERSLVIPIEHAETIRLSPIAKLTDPFIENIGRMAVRYRDDYTELGERYTVAIIGSRVDMSMVVPETAISEAFDASSESLEGKRRIRFHLENFADTLKLDVGGATFFTFYRNSALLVILNLIGHFLSVTIVAYGFARLNAPGKRILFVILLSTMMLPWPVMLIPQYEIFQNLGMINTLWPLFIRAFFGNAFLIFLLRQFFAGIPLELEDAARIDGANTLQILWHVMLPLSKPALATIGVFTFWWTWNSYFEPYVYLSSVKHFTVSLGLGFFKSQYAYNFRFVMAASIIAILPIILIFFFAQRYFIEGIQLTGMKG